MNLLVREANFDDAKLMADLTRVAWAGKVAVTSGCHRETTVGEVQCLHDGGSFILLADTMPAGSVRWQTPRAKPA